MSRKIKKRKPGRVVMPRKKTPFEQLARRVEILEVIVGMDHKRWPIPEGVDAESPLEMVLAEMGVTPEELPAFLTWLHAQVGSWREGRDEE